MILYYTDTDENVLIGIASTNRSPENIIKAVSKLLEYDFIEADSEEFDELGDFEQDTVIIACNEFTEELLELIQKDIKIYLV